MHTTPLAMILSLLSGSPEAGQDGATPAVSASPASERPNVLFFILDDLNDWVGCLGGHPQALTPNIDRLAARGVLFTNAHAPAPACNPSRVAVFTGIAPHRSGLYDQSPNFRDVWPDAITLPQHLRSLGYNPLGAGKVFHKPYPDPVSWDAFFPSKDLQMAPDSVQRRLVGTVGNHSAAAVEAEASSLGDGKVAEWVSATLRRPPEQPFFLACGFHRPHDPWIAPASHYAKFPLAEIQLPPSRSDDLADVPKAALAMCYTPRADPEQSRRAVQAYLACISFADALVGQVLDALDSSACAQNTIVVLWSDNGFHMGEKQNWSKLTLWEESTRVPLIVVAPGVKAGQRCVRPVSLQDLYPTVMELCGLPPVAGIDGHSLVPLLEDSSAVWERPALTTWGFQNHAVRSERWRYIRYADGSEELYDHEQDPNEWTNLAGDPRHAPVKLELSRWFPTENAADVKAAKAKRAGTTRERPGR
ncbi:MAG: sulfatase [Planctomycetes bacterium]|nr:sulfatase [Planctomycetota bacterium]